MSARTFSEHRPTLGIVEVVVPAEDMVIDEGNIEIRSYPLPGDIAGRVLVHVLDEADPDDPDSEIEVLKVSVEGVPDNADIVFEGYLTWGAGDDQFGGRTSVTWLRGNGCLLVLNNGLTHKLSAKVTVYGAPVHEAPDPDSDASSPKALPDVSCLRSLTALADVTLRAAGRDFPAHRLVLAGRSPVFQTMFLSDFKEATDKVVDIALDCSAEVFGLFLDSLYSGALGKQSCADLIPLLELAERYLVENLKAECVRQLLAVKVDEVLLVFQAALELPFIPKEVSAKAGEVIRNNWQAVYTSETWPAFEEAQPVVALSLKIVMGGLALT